MKGSGTGKRWRFLTLQLLLTVPAHLAHSQPSALEPASTHARNIETLWWWMFYGATAIFIAVMALLAMGLWRARKTDGNALSELASRNLVITAGVAIPLVILLALVGGSLVLGRSIAAEPPDNALHARVTGKMWWWVIEYLDTRGEPVFTTANELHVPVGRPVVLHLTSADVIHSFWVPNLHGKTDLVPGVVNTSWFTADTPGVFRGQCAEFCGVQHALMAFLVIAQPEREFQRWMADQQQPAKEPATEQEQLGQATFLSAGCAACHTIRGTNAAGKLGPDLTHLDSRKSLAAVTRPNTHGHLAGWISDPQSIKPGNFMPPTLLSPEEHLALLAYLESLD